MLYFVSWWYNCYDLGAHYFNSSFNIVFYNAYKFGLSSNWIGSSRLSTIFYHNWSHILIGNLYKFPLCIWRWNLLDNWWYKNCSKKVPLKLVSYWHYSHFSYWFDFVVTDVSRPRNWSKWQCKLVYPNV